MKIVQNIQYRLGCGISREPYVFIWGCPRSGTTLLKTLLVSHPELGGTWRESTGILGLKDITKFTIGEIEKSETTRVFEESHNIVEFYDGISSIILKAKEKMRFVDKLQPRSLRFKFVAKHFPESKFIHIVRDGRDAYCSAMKHPNIKQAGSIERFARYWKNVVSMASKIEFSDRIHTLRYEDLAYEPEDTLGSAMKFIGMEALPNQLNAECYSKMTHERKRAVHENLNKPINATSCERWREELSEEENSIFCRIAGKWLESYDYSLM